MAERQRTRPRNYFLNEAHELPLGEKPGGGRTPHYLEVDWTARSRQLASSLERIEKRAASSLDPLSQERYYILVAPVAQMVKESKAKDAKQGRKVEKVSFSAEQAFVFGRVGLDLIEVHPSGEATVHASPERIEQLRFQTSGLAQLGLRDQARWIAIEEFQWLPGRLKFDEAWLREVGSKKVEAYIKLQPLINEIEAEKVLRRLDSLLRQQGRGNIIKGKGRSYLGRIFFRAILDVSAIRSLAEDFTSIQSIHPPIIAQADSWPNSVSGSKVGVPSPSILQAPSRSLPCVAVVDTAVPDNHLWLKPYRRGVVLGTNCLRTENDAHGSMVASRIVFGDMAPDQGGLSPECSFLEVRVGMGVQKILAESVVDAMRTAISSSPDVRVFNLSFDSDRRLDDMLPKQRAETLRILEELDNLIFDQDILAVAAAGNVSRGIIPTPEYPDHFNDPGWELHSFPRSFNSLTCGGTIARLTMSGIGDEINAPSPFARIGPGFARSPKPDFCAPAGDCDSEHQGQPGQGVWGFSSLGEFREDFGTSFAAPLLAREAAFLLDELKQVCLGDARPFSCTAKAILALTADDCTSALSPSLQPLARRTLGYGRASVAAYKQPQFDRARFFWQGLIEHQDDLVRVQLPIPKEWLIHSGAPHLRIFAAWDTPVCAAALASWASRDVTVALRATPEGKPLKGTQRVAGYPLFERVWSLSKFHEQWDEANDLWTVETKYSDIAPISAGHQASRSQRVAFAAELWDHSESPLDPHSYIQGLPLAGTLNRLSNSAIWQPQPVTLAANF